MVIYFLTGQDLKKKKQSDKLFKLVQVYLDERGDGAYPTVGQRPGQYDKRFIGKHYSLSMHHLYRCCGGCVIMKSPN